MKVQEQMELEKQPLFVWQKLKLNCSCAHVEGEQGRATIKGRTTTKGGNQPCKQNQLVGWMLMESCLDPQMPFLFALARQLLCGFTV